MIVALKWPLSVAAAVCMLPQAPSASSWQGYAAFAAVLGIMMTLLEIGKRMLDLSEKKRMPDIQTPAPGNGQLATLKQISRVLSRVETGLNANTTALALLQQMHDHQVEDSKTLAECLSGIEKAVADIKRDVSQWAA